MFEGEVSPVPSGTGDGTPLAAVRFDFYGVGAEVSSPSPAAVEEFRRDFQWFHRPVLDAAPRVRVGLFPARPPDGALSPGQGVRDRGAVRTVTDGDALAEHDFAAERGRIFCADPDRLHELGYLLLLSRVGRFLDRKGLHRVHGLGFQWRGRGALVLLPVGGGKTTLALEMLKDPAFRLLSEDTPLVDRRGRLWPFPVRFGVRSEQPLPGIPAERQRLFRRRFHGAKVLVDVDWAAGRWAPPSAVAPHVLLVGRRPADGPGAVSRGSRLGALWPLVWNLLIGFGVPQGREYLLRPRFQALWDLALAGLSRAWALGVLLLRCRVYGLRLGRDAAADARAILRTAAS